LLRYLILDLVKILETHLKLVMEQNSLLLLLVVESLVLKSITALVELMVLLILAAVVEEVTVMVLSIMAETVVLEL